MSTYDPQREQAAYNELDQLTTDFRAAEEALEAARTRLQEGIVKHMSARSAPVGKLADHTPYDRNHVGRIARAAGVPSLRESKK
jgi:Ni,Fe-hydrogenase III large subunit